MKKIVFGITAVLATVSLAAVPMTAHARDNGAAIALGVIGGVAAGAAIASTANPYFGGYSYPYYTAPASSYYYPQSTYYAPQSDYYPQSTYYAPQSYYYPQSTYYAPSSYYGSYHSDGY